MDWFRKLRVGLLAALVASLAADVTPQSMPQPPGVPALTPSRALASDLNGLPVAATPTTDELNRIAGLTSPAQTQLDARLPLTGGVLTGTLALTSSDAGAANGPLLQLARTSASPAISDDLGALDFYGRNASAADVRYGSVSSRIDAPTAGAESGQIRFSVLANGVDTVVAQIKSTGLRIQPLPPSRALYLDANRDVAASAVTATELATLSGINSLRSRMTVARTFYVDPTVGNDANDGSVGTPFLTIQKALDTLQSLDLGGLNHTIQLADGTYTSAALMWRNSTGAGRVILRGNLTNPENVIISTTSADAVSAIGPGSRLQVNGVELRTTTSGVCARGSQLGELFINTAVRFGACASASIQADSFGSVSIEAGYTIAGNSGAHFVAQSQGRIAGGGTTLTLSGTRAFPQGFAFASNMSNIYLPTMTFVGSATGPRYLVNLNSVIFTNGGGSTYFPGNAAGSATTGGQYN